MADFTLIQNEMVSVYFAKKIILSHSLSLCLTGALRYSRLSKLLSTAVTIFLQAGCPSLCQ